MADGVARTIGGLRQSATARLKAAGVEGAAAEARRLVAAAGIDPVELVVRPDAPAAAGAAEVIEWLLTRRERREPLSRILGEREFFGRLFRLSAGTLDPRPDTEVLVETALDIVGDRARPVRLLDVGTGTGILAISLLAELPHATALAVDLSDDALSTARANAERHGVANRLRLERRDLFDRGWLREEAPFDLIVSNPPYIPSLDIATLEPEVRLHDPHLALDGGADGLDAYRALGGYQGALVAGGWLAVEVGAGQSGDVARLLGAATSTIRIVGDLSGHERVVAVQPRSRGGD